MKRYKDYFSIGLFLIGLIVFIGIQLIFLPNRYEAEERYAQEQMNPLTQDFNYINEYESEYMGDNSNTINLFRNLPMTQNDMTFQLYPEELKIEVHYPTTLNEAAQLEIGYDENEKDSYRALLYNATAGFALIKNVEQLTFIFEDKIIDFERSDIETLYTDLDWLIDENTWISEVQQPLENDQYVEDSLKKVSTVHD
ncbi:DUF4825 domain-containing protein [Marinilactibacillus kalidii]|uniref:DUF4825 domain-containing protein n=1 Tax=Marinilactibacillus kalidii TaxID=2820274 RepID=UPI001ABDC51E|nr:DUF4825 domain-containing protein [Marinilactibacillus kalidii]